MKSYSQDVDNIHEVKIVYIFKKNFELKNIFLISKRKNKNLEIIFVQQGSQNIPCFFNKVLRIQRMYTVSFQTHCKGQDGCACSILKRSHMRSAS